MIKNIGDGVDISNTQWTMAVWEYGGDLRRILFRVTSMTLMLVEERFHKTHPYRDRQYVWIRKLFTNGSTEENEQN